MFSSLLDAIRLVLERKDRRDDQRFSDADLKAAMIELYEFADEWSTRAQELRDAVERWQESGYQEDDPFFIVREILEKMRYVDLYGMQAQALRKFLRLYAPDLEADLARLAERSSANLGVMVRRIVEAKQEGPAALDSFVEAFVERTDEVVEAVERLRVYIATNYPAYR